MRRISAFFLCLLLLAGLPPAALASCAGQRDTAISRLKSPQSNRLLRFKSYHPFWCISVLCPGQAYGRGPSLRKTGETDIGKLYPMPGGLSMSSGAYAEN